MSGYYPPGVGFRFNALDNGGEPTIVFDGNQFINNDDAGIQIFTDFGTIDKVSFVGNTLSGNGDKLRSSTSSPSTTSSGTALTSSSKCRGTTPHRQA